MKTDISQLITNIVAIAIILTITHFTVLSSTHMLVGALLITGVFKTN